MEVVLEDNRALGWTRFLGGDITPLRLKYALTQNDGGVWGEDPDGDQDTIVLRSTEQAVDGEWRLDDPAWRKLTQVERASALLFEGDLVVTKSSGSALHIGKTSLVTAEIAEMGACYGNFMQRIRPSKGFDSRYLWYLLNHDIVRSQFDLLSNSTTGLANLNASIIGSVMVPQVDVNNQRLVVQFLDHETAKIDTLISKQERLIDVLGERRSAMITHVTTRGLNQGVAMTCTDVGLAPQHWIVAPLKRFVKSLDSERIPLSAEERGGRQGDFAYYGASGVIDRVDDFLFDEDLVLVSEDGANLLSRSTPIAFKASGRYWVNNHAHVLRPRNTAIGYWAARVEAEDLTTIVRGAAQPKLTAEALMNLKIAAPPTESECLQIEAFIVGHAAKIDALIDKAKAMNVVLRERRSALISAVVTGKIDVTSGIVGVA